MSAFKDLTGLTFNSFTVLHRGLSESGRPLWVCRCVCGNIRNVFGSNLRGKKHQSCGCVIRVYSASHHFMTDTPMYQSWRDMKKRCLLKTTKDYPNYGGRGITVCERWLKFKNFLVDMGEMPPGMTLDRIDNNGNYEPGNCRWITNAEQQKNKRTTLLVEYRGERKTVGEWAAQFGVPRDRLDRRLRMGWSIANAVGVPPRGNARARDAQVGGHL